MDSHFRQLFNEQFSDALYTRYQRDLSGRINAQFDFRLAESPVFLPDDFKACTVKAAQEILEQLSRKEQIEKMREAIPQQWDTPGMDALPSFAQVDFAVTRDAEGKLAPKLIELQGFPSLTGLQVVQRDQRRKGTLSCRYVSVRPVSTMSSTSSTFLPSSDARAAYSSLTRPLDTCASP